VGEFEPYIVAKSIYTVSKDKAKKLLNILYSNVKELDEVSMCITIAKGMQENSCGQFFTYLSEAKNGK